MNKIPKDALPEIRKKILALARPEDFHLAKDFLERHGGADVATIQMAADPGEKERERITRDLANQGILARIRIDRDLAGGARLFKDGTLKDASWKGRVRRILSAIYA
jgi:hypothetical protein